MSEQSCRLRPVQLGLSLGTFLLVGYIACLALALVVPDRGLHQPWLQFYVGFNWTPQGILLGVVEAVLFGFVGGFVFAWIANFFGISRSA